MAKLSPIESEFATTQEAEAYDEALDSTEPDVPHDVVIELPVSHPLMHRA
eukprot:gene21289-22116_t